MPERFSRTELLIGKNAVDHLSKCRVAVFGIGGVGGYVCEALVRSGIGAFDLIDDDKVCTSNLNRQIIATEKTIGRHKVDVMKERILDINPEARVNVYKCFFLPENASEFPFESYDYVIDAIDTVTAKIELVMQCMHAGTPIISSMGAGNKLDPTLFRVADIYKTKTDPLARVMRRELKKRGVKKLKVVYSEEIPMTPLVEVQNENDMGRNAMGENVMSENVGDDHRQSGEKRHGTGRRSIPGSTAFVPSVAGLVIASEVIKDLTAGA